MRRTWTWRSAVLGAMAVLAGSLAVGHTLAGGIADAAPAPTIERYNPYVSGNRLVFTQVQRAADGSTTAGIWARDLTTGTESLVADVATGEPMPVTSDTWTAWSDSPADGRVAVHARANRGGPVLDLFTTDQSRDPFTGTADYTVPVALSGSELTALNGNPVSESVAELARFSLPNRRASLVDVMSTSPFPARAAIASSASNTVIAEGNTVLFSIVDGRGRVVASLSNESTGCFEYAFNGEAPSITFDGDRIGMLAACLDPSLGYYGVAIVTCTLPCRAFDVISLPASIVSVGFEPPRGLTSANGRFYFELNNSFNPQAPGAAIYGVDAVAGATPEMVWSTGDTIGPRLSADRNRLVWDQSGYHRGRLESELYQRDLRTGTVSVLRATGSQDVTLAPRVRHDPDISGDTVVYADRALDGSSAGIWTRSLTGGLTLVSAVASDTSAPRVRDGWTAWNTKDPSLNAERVLASRGPGRSVVDVYSTNIANFGPYMFTPDQKLPVDVDLAGGGRILVNGWEDSTIAYAPCCSIPTYRQRTLEGRLPSGALTPLGELATQSNSLQSQGRGDGRNSVALVYGNYPTPTEVRLYNRAGTHQALAMPTVTHPQFGAFACQPQLIDISSTDVVGTSYCSADGSMWLASCDLPCSANALSNAIRLPDEVDPVDPTFTFTPSVEHLTAVGSLAAIATRTVGGAGRYHTRMVVGDSISVYDLAHAQNDPIIVTTESGAMSAPRIDGTRMVFGVQSGQGRSAVGTLYLFDLRTRTLSTL